MALRSTNGGGLLGFINTVAIETARAPGDIAQFGYDVGSPDVVRLGYNLNDQLINEAGQIQSAVNRNAQYTGGEVAKQLAGTKARQVGDSVINFLSSPANLILTVAGVVLSLILIRKV